MFDPDYQLPVEDIFTRCAARLIPEDPFLLLLAGIGMPRSKLSLPSWVPDFSCSAVAGVQIATARARDYAAGVAYFDGDDEEIPPDLLFPQRTQNRIIVKSGALQLKITKIDVIERVLLSEPSKNLAGPLPQALNIRPNNQRQIVKRITKRFLHG